jgi:hypothetical protein
MTERSDHGALEHPITPDGRYFVVRGRLWRRSDPRLSNEEKGALIHALMKARRAIATANRLKDDSGRSCARAEIDRLKRALGERGPVWWDDGAPDYNRHMARNTPYASWFADQTSRPSDANR